MSTQGKNHTVTQIGSLESLAQHHFHGVPGKRFVGANLGLTGCEASLNRLPAGVGMPFVHAHKQNEELYIVLRGAGIFHVDGEEFPVCEGSVVRVAPDGARAVAAGSEDLYFICIQAQAGSLSQATLEDGYPVSVLSSWMTG